ncbi:hypothetical protein [Mycobacterium sp.]|uniref:hypothetical protein n=1 Tax=Mycobacterium sp. TaxID=1785 RepID=UPI003D0C5FFB
MQLALRPYATAGVAVLGAGLIYVTPTTAVHIGQHAVDLAAVEDFIDLVTPVDAGMSTLIGAGGSASASVTDALTSGGGALSAEVSGALPSATDLELLDPAFWAQFWFELTDPDAGSAAELLLVNAIEQLPVIGPLLVGFGVALFPITLLLAYAWSEISQLLGIEPYGPAADVLPAGVSTALDPNVLLSVLDLNPMVDIGTVVDPAGLADIGTAIEPAALADVGIVLSISTIPDPAEILASLIP